MDSTSRLIYEAYKPSNQFIDSDGLKKFIEFYEQRTSELNPDGDATGEFLFHINNNTLNITCDIIHIDTILNSIPESEALNFDFSKRFSFTPYIIPVIKALEEAGLKGKVGMFHSHGSIILGSLENLGEVTVNDYTGETLTVQLKIPNILQNFDKNRQQLANTIDAFITRMHKAIKLCETKYFKPQSL